MKFKKMTRPLTINWKCSCGKLHATLPDDHKVTDGEEYLAGIWFNCDACGSTMVIPAGELDPEWLKEAA